MPGKLIAAEQVPGVAATPVREARPLVCRGCGSIRLDYMPLGWHCPRCGAVSYRDHISYLGSCWSPEDCRRLAFYRWEVERGAINEGVGPQDTETFQRLVAGEPPAFTRWTRRELRALEFARWRFEHGQLNDRGPEG